MTTVFFNGLNAKAGGGRSILKNLLSLLNRRSSEDRYFVLVPQKKDYQRYASKATAIIELPPPCRRMILYPGVNYWLMPRLLKKLNIDVVFNLSDVVIPTKIPQLYLFDWAYAVYPGSVVWEKMGWGAYLTRKIKLHYFRKYIRRATLIVAQTKTMRTRLGSIYGLENIEIVPNAVSLETTSCATPHDFGLPEGRFKLLYLTYYYPHKNVEILLPVARKIKAKKLPFTIVTTIGEQQHKSAGAFLDSIRRAELEDVIVNLGPVPMAQVPALYAQSDALLMPTLLESFSGCYVEAMYHGRTIITSDMDFARDVCGEAAFYFDPLDPDSILGEIVTAFGDHDLRRRKIKCGARRMDRFLSWEAAFDKYMHLLQELNSKRR